MTGGDISHFLFFSFDHMTFPAACKLMPFGTLQKKILIWIFSVLSHKQWKSETFAKDLMPLAL